MIDGNHNNTFDNNVYYWTKICMEQLDVNLQNSEIDILSMSSIYLF